MNFDKMAQHGALNFRKIRWTKKYRKRLRMEKMNARAKKLEDNLPKSEIWFRAKFEAESIPRIYSITKHSTVFKDRYNTPFKNTYIPDIINTGYSYVIEIDGDIHDTAYQKRIDGKKDKFYTRCLMKVFRVKAFDDESYNQFIIEYKAYLETLHSGRYKYLVALLKNEPLPKASRFQIRDGNKLSKITKILNNANEAIIKPKVILRKAPVDENPT